MAEPTPDPTPDPTPGPTPDLRAHTMSPVRTRYLAAARTALELLASDELGTAWDDASVLAEFGVADLAGHLARSGVLVVEELLDRPDPASPAPIGAGAYYAAFGDLTDVHAPLNVGVRDRGHEVAVQGQERMVAAVSATLERLADRLAAEPADRQVDARGGQALLLDEYLRTRCVEIAVHTEDLELSVRLGPGLTAADPVPDVPDDAVADAVAVLVETAVARHGAQAVLRGLARRERDVVQALRVF